MDVTPIRASSLAFYSVCGSFYFPLGSKVEGKKDCDKKMVDTSWKKNLTMMRKCFTSNLRRKVPFFSMVKKKLTEPVKTVNMEKRM